MRDSAGRDTKGNRTQDAESVDINSVGVITSSQALSDKVHSATYISSLLENSSSTCLKEVAFAGMYGIPCLASP